MHKSFYFAVTCCRYGVQALCSERIALTNQTTTPAFSLDHLSLDPLPQAILRGDRIHDRLHEPHLRG